MRNPPSWRTILKYHPKMNENDAKDLAKEMLRVWKKTGDFRTVLAAYSKALGWHRYEYLFDKRTKRATIAYANTGDSYKLTLLYFLDSGFWSFNSWGNRVEQNPYRYE